MSTSIKAITAMVLGVYSFCVQVILYTVGVCTSLFTIMVALVHLSVRAYVYGAEMVHPAANTIANTTKVKAIQVKDGADKASSTINGGLYKVAEKINTLLKEEG